MENIGNIRLIGYCKCCVDGLKAMRLLSGDAVESAVTIIARPMPAPARTRELVERLLGAR